MNLEKAVLVVSTAGEQILGERTVGRKEFDETASSGVAFVLHDSRRFEAHHVPMGNPNSAGQTMVRVVFDLTPIEPFTVSPPLYVRASRWSHIEDGDHNLKSLVTGLVKKSEEREVALRASAAGIQLAGGPLPHQVPSLEKLRG